MRRALKGALATLDRATGTPYASLVTVATDADGTPLFLISRLALHTQNLLADARASVMIDGTSAEGDPLAGGRVTLMGRMRPATSPAARRRFLARHTAADVYADFPDFGFFALDIERAHFIGGFGRIVDLAAADILLDVTHAARLVEAEPVIVAHMNADHADAVRGYARLLNEAGSGPWTMTGLDPEGCDLVALPHTARVMFDQLIATPGEARKELARLAALTRA